MKSRVLIAFILSLATVGHAQPNFDRATRETDRAMSDSTMKRVTGQTQRTSPRKVSISVDTNPVAKPSDEAEEKFIVREVDITGMRSLAPEDVSTITKKYTNREISSSDLNKLTKAIEMEYLRRGMVAVVFVPAQDIEDGVLQVRVIEKNE